MAHNPNDTVTIAPGVLLTIVRMATQSVEGVVRTTSTPGGVDRWFRRASDSDGIRIEVMETGVRVNVYLVVDAAQNLYETSRHVQEEIARTINEFAGMKISAVNVHIEDVVFSK